MSTVYLSSPTNSTFFTTCCSVAINDDQSQCPKCREVVEPRSHRARWEKAYGPIRNGTGSYGRFSTKPDTK